MTVIRWNDPFRDLATLQDRMNRVFDRTLAAPGPQRGGALHRDLGSPVDIFETKDKIVLKAELPGFDENQIHLRFEDGILSLEGERKFEKESGDENYHRVERSYGKFVRSFTIPGERRQREDRRRVRERHPHRRAAEARGDEAEADQDPGRRSPPSRSRRSPDAEVTADRGAAQIAGRPRRDLLFLEEVRRDVALRRRRDDEDDELPRALRALRDLDGRVRRGAGRDPAEDSLLLREAPRHRERLVVRDLERLVDEATCRGSSG